MSFYPKGLANVTPTVVISENGNNLVEWNVIAEQAIDESVLPTLSKKLSVNDVIVSCFKSGENALLYQCEFSSLLRYEIYWDTSIRNLLVIEKEIGNLVSIEDCPRKYCKLNFAINEHVGGFNVDKTNLMIAVENQNTEEVTKIIKKSSLEEINTKTPFGNTALHYAIISKNVELVQTLIKAGANTNVFGEIIPLQYASVANLEITQLLISNKTKIDFSNRYNETALMFAASSGKTEIVSWLLENGADKSLDDVFSETALIKAEKNKHYEIVKILI
jgi:ankyrin repeat protein